MVARRVFFCLVLLALAACRSGRRDAVPVVIDPELMRLTKEESFAKGEALNEAKKYAKARRYFAHVYESYPNDPLGRKGLLRIADTYFGQGDAVSLVEAQYKYRDFINRYPGADSADYAMYQIANISFKQIERPDRDQEKTREAVEKYRQMIEAFPRSVYRSEADIRLGQALDRLARHEHIVARFYMKRTNWSAALGRLNGLLDDYPGYSARDSVFFDLGISLQRLGRNGEAQLYMERVLSEFPDSEYAAKAKAKLQEWKA